MSLKKQNISKNKNSLLVRFSVWGIKIIYRRIIKPFKAKKDCKKGRVTVCSFYPSCSEYGVLAVRKDGFFKGWYKTINRILRCKTYQHKGSCVNYP